MNGNKSRGEDRENRAALTRPVTATFGLRSTAKLRDVHMSRLALVYVRQSTPQQVLANRESRERQYALAEFAQRLGWPAERVVVILSELNQSHKPSERADYLIEYPGARFGFTHSLRRVFLAEISNTTFPSEFVVTHLHSCVSLSMIFDLPTVIFPASSVPVQVIVRVFSSQAPSTDPRGWPPALSKYQV